MGSNSLLIHSDQDSTNWEGIFRIKMDSWSFLPYSGIIRTFKCAWFMSHTVVSCKMMSQKSIRYVFIFSLFSASNIDTISAYNLYLQLFHLCSSIIKRGEDLYK